MVWKRHNSLVNAGNLTAIPLLKFSSVQRCW